MRKVLLTVFLLFALEPCSFASDEVYIWTDEQGQLQSSDQRPEGWEKGNYKKVRETVISGSAPTPRKNDEQPRTPEKRVVTHKEKTYSPNFPTAEARSRCRLSAGR